MPTTSSDDLSNLGIDADVPEELGYLTSTSEEAVLRQAGLLPANVNVDLRNHLERNRAADEITNNILHAIAGTRSTFTYGELRALLDPAIQRAVETVAHPAGNNREQATTLALAQAIYEVVPKEAWHVMVEQQINNRYVLPAERTAATAFYNSLRQGNDANDMIAGMAVLMAMQDPTGAPVANPLATPPIPSWEAKYVNTRLATAQQGAMTRKNAAETVQQFKTIQPIALPAGVSPAANEADIRAAINDIIRPGGARAVLGGAITAWEARERTYQADMAQYDIDYAHWEDENTRNKAEQQRFDQAQAAWQLQLQAHVMHGGPPPPAPTVPPATPVGPRPVKPRQPGFPGIVLPGTFAASITTIEAARAKLAELETAERTLNAALVELAARGNMLVAITTIIQGLRIPNIVTSFPILSSVCAGGPPPVVNAANLTANFNFAGLAAEIERNFPGGLKTVEEYSRELASTPTQLSPGSDLALNVFRSHIRRLQPSLSDTDIDQVANYIMNRTRVDGILRSSVNQGVEQYLNVGSRTITDNVVNRAFNWMENEYMSRSKSTVFEIARSAGIPIINNEPDWQGATYEQTSTAYFALKTLIDGKGPKALDLSRKPDVAVNAFRTLANILSTRYAGKIEQNLIAALPEAEKQSALRSRSKTADAVKRVLLGDTPAWAKPDVDRALNRADRHASWVSRGAYSLGEGAIVRGKNVGGWMLGKGGEALQGGKNLIKTYGKDAATITAFSLLGGPVLGVVAWYAMKHFAPGKKAAAH